MENEGLSQHVLLDLKLLHVGRQPGCAWLLCGGFGGPQFYPDSLLPAVHWLEKVPRLMPSLFAGRLMVVVEKKPA